MVLRTGNLLVGNHSDYRHFLHNTIKDLTTQSLFPYVFELNIDASQGDEDALDKRHKIAKEISSALYSHTFTDLSRYIGRHFSNALCSFSRVRVTTEDILHAVWEENRNR